MVESVPDGEKVLRAVHAQVGAFRDVVAEPATVLLPPGAPVRPSVGIVFDAGLLDVCAGQGLWHPSLSQHDLLVVDGGPAVQVHRLRRPPGT